MSVIRRISFLTTFAIKEGKEVQCDSGLNVTLAFARNKDVKRHLSSRKTNTQLRVTGSIINQTTSFFDHHYGTDGKRFHAILLFWESSPTASQVTYCAANEVDVHFIGRLLFLDMA